MEYRVPYGYRIVTGELMVFEDQADIVREIFARYCDGVSMNQIADDLNYRKVVYTGGKPSWTHVIVGKILKNRVYLGDQYYQRIISDDEFERVQEIRRQYCKSRGRGVYRPDKAERELFEGILICAECGLHYRRLRPCGSAKKISKWKCKHKQGLGCPEAEFSDEQIKKICVVAINRIIEDNYLIREAKEPGDVFSKAYFDLEHQIEAFQNDNIEELFNLIVRRAEERYMTLNVRNIRYLTETMLRLIDGREKLKCFDEELYRGLIKGIYISSDHDARVVFINGVGLYVRF